MLNYFRIVTFNLRYSWDGDGENSFIYRGPLIVEKISSSKPQIIGFQEATDKNIEYLRNNLPEYEFVFNQREKNMAGEGVAIAYLRDALVLLSSTFFWLSSNPYLPGSKYDEQGVCPRVCQSVMLMRKSDRKIMRFYNTHLDIGVENNRIKGIRDVLDFVAKEKDLIVKTPIFIMGDFNALPNSETIKMIENYKAFLLVDTTTDISTTFHNFSGAETNKKIDYIYIDSETALNPYKAECWTDNKDGVYLSDHYPVELKIEL